MALLVALSVLASCTITQQLNIGQQQNNKAFFDFSVEDFFIAVLEDFSDFSASDTDQDLMDKAIDEFRLSLARSSSTGAVSLTKSGKNAWSGSFSFTDLQRLFVDLGAGPKQSLLTLGENSMTFNLSMDNYAQLVPLIPFLADPNFEAFGPLYNQGLSEDDYLEMISFMLGDEGVPAIEASTITLKIETPRPIKRFTAGSQTGERSYEFSFRLIDFLLLDKPIAFSVNW